MKILWCVWSKHASIIWVKHANFSVTVNTNPMASFNVCRNNIQCIVSLILATSLLSNQQQQLLKKDCLWVSLFMAFYLKHNTFFEVYLSPMFDRKRREREFL